MFEELYPAIFDLFITDLKMVFPDFRIYNYEVSDVDKTVFPYIVVYPLSLPRRRYLADQRNFEFDFRVRFVDRQPVSKSYDKTKELLGLLGKFVDNFDAKYYTVNVNDKDISILGDTRDMGVSSTFVRDNTYVIIGMSFVYHFETAKYKK